MAKPRIIIADTEEDYIIPLQLQFVKEFFEKVDIEIITEKEYFNEFFSAPQHIDILIVSTELYDESIKKNNIPHIFVMTEQDPNGYTADLLLNYIYKYTSVKEVFNEIAGKSADVLNITVSAKKEAEIILVYSAAGGVGKTTVAMGISACLAKSYKRVLYINAAYLHTFQSHLENRGTVSGASVYSNLSSGRIADAYVALKPEIRKEGFNYIPPFKAALMSLGFDYSIYEQLTLEVKKSNDYDFIVIDVDTGFDENKASLIGVADKVVVVTSQTKTSVFATNTLVANINGSSEDKYLFICNDFDKEADNALISPELSGKFVTSEYINHFNHYDYMKIEDFAGENSMQKIAFLII